jgi:hypothetical protein
MVWCGVVLAPERDICEWHAARVQRAERQQQARVERRLFVQEVTTEYMEMDPQPPWQWVVEDTYRRAQLRRADPDYLADMIGYDVCRRFFILTTPPTEPTIIMTNYWTQVWREGGGVGQVWVAEAPVNHRPQGPLERLAGDGQNVHREVVVKQTNSNLDILLETPVADSQKTEILLTTWWLTMPRQPKFVDYFAVMSDVHEWFMRKTCKTDNDYLYRRVLRGAVAKIEENPHREELIHRLWEECSESVGLCCEGHLARIANVFVGFDDTFKTPVSLGEVVQQKMASIAELKLSPKHKVAKAQAMLEELGMTAEEQAPWLEALAE